MCARVYTTSVAAAGDSTATATVTTATTHCGDMSKNALCAGRRRRRQHQYATAAAADLVYRCRVSPPTFHPLAPHTHTRRRRRRRAPNCGIVQQRTHTHTDDTKNASACTRGKYNFVCVYSGRARRSAMCKFSFYACPVRRRRARASDGRTMKFSPHARRAHAAEPLLNRDAAPLSTKKPPARSLRPSSAS